MTKLDIEGVVKFLQGASTVVQGAQGIAETTQAATEVAFKWRPKFMKNLTDGDDKKTKKKKMFVKEKAKFHEHIQVEVVGRKRDVVSALEVKSPVLGTTISTIGLTMLFSKLGGGGGGEMQWNSETTYGCALFIAGAWLMRSSPRKKELMTIQGAITKGGGKMITLDEEEEEA